MSRKMSLDPDMFKDVLSAMSEARLEEGAKRKGRRWSLDTITPRFNLWKRSGSVIDGGLLSHRNSIATPVTITEEDKPPPPRGRMKKVLPHGDVYAVLDLADGRHIVLSGRDESHLKTLYVDAAMEYKVSSYRVIVASTKSILKLDNGSPTVTKSFENMFEKYESVDPSSQKSEDPRFRLAEELLQTEREYCSHLQCIFDCYAEPLRKYSSLSKEDHRMLFMAVEPILSVSAMLASKLESVIQTWNTHTTKIGNLFPSKFWNQYAEYYDNYNNTKSFLEDKCASDSTFAEFCNLRKEQGKLGIDTLLFLPIKRIPEYDKYLNDLLDETDSSHTDFDDLKKAVDKVNNMVREREDELREADNDNKVEAVQDRFPHDDLQLRDRDKAQKQRGISATRRKSAPSAVLFKPLGSGKSKSSSSLWSHNMVKKEGDVSTRPGSEGNRLYVMEGSAQLAAGMQTQDRYLFLFSDLLLIAKQKSNTTFKLKHRIQLCDVWISNCIEEVSELTRPQDRSFVIGWPTTNTVATFKDAETKDKWLTKLTAQIQEEKLKEESRTTQLKVVNRHIDQKCSVTVNNTCEAKDVLRMCMAQLLIQESEQKDYQLWVLTGKETIYPLIGHEYPYAIKLSHVRDLLKPKGDVDSDVLSNMDSIMEESSNSKVEFILKHKKSPKKHSLEDTSQKSLKKAKKSPLLALFKKNKDEKSQAPGCSKPGKLFERPLEEVCDEHSQPPKPIMELLTILFREGPFTGGILRKSANARQIRELRQKLDSEEEVSLDQYSRYLIGSLVKDYFRTLPSCLLGENLHEHWVKTVDIENEDERLSRVIELYQDLPLCNQHLLKLLMSVLYQIDHHQDVNMMNANNISVCIAPSLLWKQQDDMANYSINVSSVVSVVEFMIKNVCSVFGDDTPHLLGEVDHKMRQDSGTDSDSLNNGLRRDDSSIDSLVDRDLYTEADASPKLAKSHLSPSNLSHDSGLSHSDSQLNDEECDFDTERKMYRSTSYMDHDNDIYTRSIENIDNQNPVPPPRFRRKKEYVQSSSFDNYNRQYITSYSSGARLCHSLEPEVLRQMQLQKRISCDSLHSVEESTEGESEKDFSSHRKSADIYLIKSASGAHLYMDSETLPRVSSVEGQPGRQGRDRLVRQSSVTDSTPPLSPHSKHSYGSSYDSVLSDSSYMHDLSRGTSINSAPQTPDVDSDRVLWSLEERERSNSNPTTLHSNVNFTETTSPNKLSATYGGYSLKSMQNMRYLVSPPASPAVERRAKTSESVKDPSVRHSMPAATYKTTVQKEVPAVTSPEISITYCSSGSDERLDDNDTDKVRRASFESGSSSSAPVKQISLYSQGLSSQSRLQGQRMSPRKDSTPVKASHDSAIVSQIRRNSLESASKSDDDCESRTSSLPDSLSKSKLLRNFGRNYDSESKTSSEHLDFESKRPHQPPSYQEALSRNYRIKHGIPLMEISEQDTQKQKEASARAAKLYADSVKKYYGASDDSEKSGNVMKQTSHLKQHIEQTTDPVTKTYRTVREESSSVVQVFSPDEDGEKEDIYVTLRHDQLRKDPREVYNQSRKLYEQQAKVTPKNEVELDHGPSSCSSSNSSAFSKTSLSSRASYDAESSRSYKTDSKVYSKSDSVRTSNEPTSFSKAEPSDRVKTTLNLPSVHRSLSDSADRLNKLSRYSPRVSRRDYELNKENEEQRGRPDTSPVHSVQRATYFYQPREEKQASSSASQNQYSSKVSSQNVSTSSSVSNLDKSKCKARSLVSVTVNNPTESSSSSASQDLPWSVSQLKQRFAEKSDGITTTTTTSSHFYAPEQKTSRSVSSVTITSTSRPGPPPYKSPPPFRRLADNSRLSTSSNSSNGSASNHSSSTKSHKSVSTRKFGPQSIDYGSFSSSSEDLDTLTLYPFRRKESGSGLSDQEIDCYTDISYV